MKTHSCMLENCPPNIHTAHKPGPGTWPCALISKAAPTARTITRTEKTAALLVSVSFVNIP